MPTNRASVATNTPGYWWEAGIGNTNNVNNHEGIQHKVREDGKKRSKDYTHT